MIAENVAFGIIAAAMALGAIGVVRTKNIVHAALYLVVVLAGGAAQFILLGQEFVAWVQVLVYIGAVIVLFLFGIMLTRAPMHPKESLDNNLRWPAAVTSLFLVGILTGLLVHTFHGQKLNDLEPVRTNQITNSIFTTYIIPFEVEGVLLLGALIGAVLLARKD
jgi:NADH-quinone oxidoreductase subunit J